MAHLALLAREHPLDAKNRLRRIPRVKRRQNEAARLRRLQRDAHRFTLAHLSDKNHVGIFSQRIPKPRRERRKIPAERALADEAAFRHESVLDGIFQRDDVRGAAFVHLLDKCRKRRRLARSRAPADENQPVLRPKKRKKRRRHAEARKRRNLSRQEAHGNRPRTAHAVHMRTTVPLFERKGKIQTLLLPQTLMLRLGQNMREKILQLLLRQRILR